MLLLIPWMRPARQKVSITFFDPQRYNRKKIWLTIVQVEEVKSPLRAVTQEHKGESMKALKFKK